MPKTVLFLCSGNYYRSRFAEILFNHLAEQRRLNWRASSRGLSHEFGPWNVGPISVHALEGLKRCGIPGSKAHRMPIRCEAEDLAGANMVIALKEAEHRPLLDWRFPGWSDRVRFWTIHDIDAAAPQDALPELERHVRELVDRLCAADLP
jgi:protein-tyrosine-phosphatase